MSLYNQLAELENISRAIQIEFVDICHNNAITKTLIRDHLDKLKTSSEKFIDSARRVHSILYIYHDELAIIVTGAKESKFEAWKNLDVWLDALPSNLDEDRRATPIIRFYKVLPTKQLVHKFNQQLSYPSMSQAELEKEGKEIKYRILNQLITSHSDILDLRDKAALSAQIESFSDTIDKISTCKLELAKFIKKNYPVSKILE